MLAKYAQITYVENGKKIKGDICAYALETLFSLIALAITTFWYTCALFAMLVVNGDIVLSAYISGLIYVIAQLIYSDTVSQSRIKLGNGSMINN